MRFLDTDVLLRYLTRDDEDKARRALALLERVEAGRERVTTTPLVIFETIFTLQKFYRVERITIREQILTILSLPGLKMEGKQLVASALEHYVSAGISFADAYSAAFMQSTKIDELYSWDRGFDKIPGIIRVEPEET